MSESPIGKIITFYSYKGGVGRSMALANIGVLLAQMGKKVLLVDWDLEAPGLEHYFSEQTKINPKAEGGLLLLLRCAPTFHPDAFDSALTTYWLDHQTQIAILRSGAESTRYSSTLADFGWRNYFESQGGGQFLEDLRKHWQANYDFILIDSRTGVTDAGGVCTILMPDMLLLFFVANQQNVNGILKIAKAARTGRNKLQVSRFSLPILPIPSRFEGRVERKTSKRWLERIAVEFEDLYSDWLTPGVDCRTLLEQIKIPYIPEYSFDEGLPVLTEGTSDPDQIGYFYRNVAMLLSNEAAFDGEIRYNQDTESATTIASNAHRLPRSVFELVVSSTFTDLPQHREQLVKAINAQGMRAMVMENEPAAAHQDVIDFSLELVRNSSAYVGIIGMKYGQIPECPQRNPEKLSITELEFNEALRLNRPILMFIMSDDHLIRRTQIETDPFKQEKLNAFRDRAKNVTSDANVHRIYGVFSSLEEFKEKVGVSLASLHDHLGSTDKLLVNALPIPAPIPMPPALYAEPGYIGSNLFVGRNTELQALSDWANMSDPANLLLLEAIGGSGKSMLIWEWTTKHAGNVRPDWAGRFWYSFYERGAIMQDFCHHALAYITGRPLREFEKLKTAEMKDDLIAQLHARPWLLVLDGLERLLVAYHRLNPYEGPHTDELLNRSPIDPIRDEDNDILRALAACAPSKILVSSRLTPRILLNQAGLPIPGVHRIMLSGLQPTDAESLLRSCGITGDSEAIRDYLQKHCDNHPLVIVILGGLIANYLPDRGNFDAWTTDLGGGAALNLASLDLTHGRNHILRSALTALPDESRQLLSMLTLLSGSVDYETLKALNLYQSPGSSDKELAETVRDLERRGLLLYDSSERRYDLHPVVRGVVVGSMSMEDKERFGQQVVGAFAKLRAKKEV